MCLTSFFCFVSSFIVCVVRPPARPPARLPVRTVDQPVTCAAAGVGVGVCGGAGFRAGVVWGGGGEGQGWGGADIGG